MCTCICRSLHIKVVGINQLLIFFQSLRLFLSFDKDGDSRLNPVEAMEKVLSAFKRTPSSDMIEPRADQAWFKTLDKDASGFIEPGEFDERLG